MKKLIILSSLLFLLVACSHDDMSWESQIDEIKKELANQQKLLESLQEQVSITGIKYNIDNYTISFSDGTSVILNNGVTPIISIGGNGNWLINGKDTGCPSKGKDASSPQISIVDGYWYINGVNSGVRASSTITIGNNGNWFINGEDTGYPSRGEDASSPQIEIIDGYWYINGVNTGVRASNTITIGKNGNWLINGEDTGCPSRGEDGLTPSVEIIDGYWYINGKNTGIPSSEKPDESIHDKYITHIVSTYAKLIFYFSDGTSIETEIVNFLNNQIDLVWGSFRIKSHRGYSKGAPENTLSAFKLAKQKGFDIIETDIHFTSDGIPVCIHDNTIDRTSNGTGRVDSLTLAELKTYDFGSWKGTEFTGEKIPTFEETLVLCKRIGLKIYVELKHCPTDESARAILDLIYKYNMQAYCTFISFQVNLLDKIAKLDSNFRFGVVDSGDFQKLKSKMDWAKRLNIPNLYVGHKYSTVDEDIIDYCINNGYALEVYTINSNSAAASLHPYISGFATDNLSPLNWWQ